MIFQQNLSSVYPLNSFNNNVVRFTETDVAVTGVTRATIAITSGVYNSTFEITPNLGSFYFNFMEIFKAIINQNLFADEATYSDTEVDNNLSQIIDVEYTTYDIGFVQIDQKSYTYAMLKSVYQIEDTPILDPQYLHLAENNEIWFDVFAGFPFDFTYFQNKETVEQRSVTITNSATENVMFSLPTLNREITRVGIIDKSGTTLQQYGVGNNLELSTSFDNEIITTCGLINPKIKYHENCKGTYIKWLNTFGGWDYWLFSDKHTVKIKDNNLGEVNVNFDDIGNQNSIYANLGKEVSEIHELNASFLEAYQFNKLLKLAYSPKVYVWTDEKFIEVKMLSSNSFVENNKLGFLSFAMQLPKRLTQMI